ncbi:Phosphoserine aminotransferase [Pseudobythopirellula maris]|uniref:Phosphoserine aminotransferase n=1 Tax=Pseudobythopirellula maris TaxID=2527991 RepID=A0A5C5ZGA8_9BACT|nr:3-phosphoserine/phosphohydroxythreonine transaminase [Pseudobythopirellula maris]TWT86178.1 Phosphoserine aminotransferase [Pseudobythopirellula maris]
MSISPAPLSETPAGASVEDRVYNFSAGPAVLPLSVLERAREELLCMPGVGASILEISHRSKAFLEIIETAEANLRKLLGISDDYAVLFLQGGSRLQFSMVPMNLLGADQSADYMVTGSWGKKALEEAAKVGKTRKVYDAKETNYDRLPEPFCADGGTMDLDPQAAYLHYTSNETIQGVQFSAEPETQGVPLVCDASSEFLYKPLDIDKYGLIYACAQKNAGPAGVTIVVVRKDLAERADPNLGVYLNFNTHIASGSMDNTPPTFAIYINKLVTDWLLSEVGGLEAMHSRNAEKAKLLYDVLDQNAEFYQGHARPDCRSLMNVTFRLPSDELTTKFDAEAKQNGMTDLKGHRSVGGIRASIYNAMPLAGVETLRDFMVDFAKKNG